MKKGPTLGLYPKAHTQGGCVATLDRDLEPGPATEVPTGFRGEDSQDKHGTHIIDGLRKRVANLI